MRRSRLALGIALASLSAPAHALIPEGYCAIIVALRASMAEVQTFEHQNPQMGITDVFEAASGWYVISIGQVPLAAYEQRLAVLRHDQEGVGRS
jgi:hypothetical protein